MTARLEKLAAALPAPNPVLVRELRQMARNKFISIGLGAYLFIQLLVAALSVLAQDKDSAAHGAGIGESVANSHCVVLGILIIAALPFFTGVRMTREKASDNMDMQFTTTLKPVRFVDGKVLSAAVMALFFAAATMPFLVLAYLLRGVNAGAVFTVVATMMISSVLMSCFSVLVGSSNFPSWLRNAFMAVLVVMIMPSTFMSAMVTIRLGGSSFMMPSGTNGWLAWLTSAAAAVTAGAIMRSMAAANLSSPHSNRQLPLKSIVAIAWIVWGVIAALTGNSDSVTQWAIPSALLGNLMLANAVSMPSGCSRRVLAEISPLWRRLQFMFFTGAENGICFALTMLTATALAANLASGIYVNGISDAHRVNALAFYPAAYLLSARLLWQLALKRFLSCRVVWFIGAILMLLGILIPAFMSISAGHDFKASAVFGNIGGALFGGAFSSNNSDIRAAHSLMSGLWFTIMVAVVFPSILSALKTFRPPAKKEALQ